MSENPHIFISYPHTETQFTLRLAADLRNLGVRIWMDILEGGIKSGDDWRRAIAEGVDDSAAIIPILCPDYIKSDYCRKELARADRMRRKIFPILLRSLPDARDWPIEVESIQYVDFRGWQDEGTYRKQFEALVRELKARSAEQIGTMPSTEAQYLTRLIAELESRKGVLEYVELTAQADTPERPNPHHDTSGWDASFAIIVEQPAGTLHVATDSMPHKIPLSSIADAVQKHPRFVLIGEPGAGKTTTLRRLALEAARKRFEDPHAPLPIVFYLPAWGNEATYVDFMNAQLQKTGLVVGTQFALSALDIHLYLDGLNEMGATGAEKAKKLRDWLHSGDAPKHVIVTCRAGDYRKPVRDDEPSLYLNIPTVLADEMKEAQIRQFAANYLGEEAAPKFLARVLPEKVKDLEHARHLFLLARNPYLLAALIYIYTTSPDGDLPQNPGALMRMLAQALWERECVRQNPSAQSLPEGKCSELMRGWIPFEEVEAVLARLAFAMIDQVQPIDVPVDYALKCILGKWHWLGIGRKRISKLLRAGHNANFLELRDAEVCFYHQLMQEYFAAVELIDLGVHTKVFDPRLNQDININLRWVNVVIAACGIVSNPDDVLTDFVSLNPTLAAECIARGVKVSDSVRQRIVVHLLNVLKDPGQQVYGDPLQKPDFFFIRLGLALNDPRKIIGKLLRDVADSTTVLILAEALRDEDWLVRWYCAGILGQIGDERAVPGLIDVLNDSTMHARMVAAWALGAIGDKRAVPHLIDALGDSDRITRASAARALGKIGEGQAVSRLIETLRDPYAGARVDAIWALEQIADIRAVPELIERLRDTEKAETMDLPDSSNSMHDTITARPTPLLCDYAAKALTHIGTPEALEAVARWRAGQL